MSEISKIKTLLIVLVIIVPVVNIVYVGIESIPPYTNNIEPKLVITDSQNNIILLGETGSRKFPMVNSYDDKISGGEDIFVVKMDPNGQILFSTYYGGYEDETVSDVVIDSQDNIIITGYTASNNLDVTENAFKSEKTGSDWDFFIAKFSKNGDLLYSSYVGGVWNEHTSQIAVNNKDEIILFGRTASADIFSSYSTTLSKESQIWDLFLMNFSPNGDIKNIRFITENKVTQQDNLEFDDIYRPVDVGIDGENNIVVLWEVEGSITTNLEGGGSSTRGAGDERTHLSKYSPDFKLLWGQNYTSINRGEFYEMCIDSMDAINVVGMTRFDNFFNESEIQASDSFSGHVQVVQFASGGSINWSYHYGGLEYDRGLSISCGKTDNLMIAGLSTSGDYPVINSYQDGFAGLEKRDEDGNLNNDIVFMKLQSNGSIIHSSYFGGQQIERLYDSTMNSMGEIFILGWSESLDMVIKPLNNELTNNEGLNFMVKIASPTEVDWALRF